MNVPSYKAVAGYNGDVLRRDLVAGATVAAIAIPQAMAYALIAGVDPRFGLYSAIVVTIVASVFGSSSHLINGPTNAISLVVFSVLVPFDSSFDAYQAMFLLAIIVGTIQILVGVFRLGDLTRYVSESVLLGFMAGAGLLVAIGQLAISSARPSAAPATRRRWHNCGKPSPKEDRSIRAPSASASAPWWRCCSSES